MDFQQDWQDSLCKGIRVLELAGVLAGPAVGMFFAELGAAVIKIENSRTGGDITRNWKTEGEDPLSPVSSYYCSVNYRKQVRYADLTQELDQQRIRDLIPATDILIANFKPGSAQKCGLDPEQAFALHPGLIYANISGFPGQDPRAAFDLVLQAETGYLSMTGSREGDLCKLPVALIDLLCAHQIKEGILLALIHKLRTGQGCLVECDLYSAALSGLINQASNYLMAGKVAKPMGCLHPNIAPYGETLISREGTPFILAIGTDQQFQALADYLQWDAGQVRDKFRTNALRLANRGLLQQCLQAENGKHPESELDSFFSNRNIPYGRIRHLDEVLEETRARKLVVEEEIDGIPTKRLRSTVFRIRPWQPSA